MRWMIICAFLTGCASMSEPPPDEGGFAKAMEQNFPNSDKEHNLDTGKNVCFKLRSGMTKEEIIMEKFDHGMSITNAALVTQLSIEYICPVWK